MAVSLNSPIIFNSALQAKYLHAPRSGLGSSVVKAIHFASPTGIVGLRRSSKKDKKWKLCLSAADGDLIATEVKDKGSESSRRSDDDDRSSAGTLPSQFQTSAETVSGPETPEDLNGSVVSSNLKQDTSPVNMKSGVKRSSLTAREKLRAARVLSRYTDTKASKPQLGNNVLEALIDSDRGKKKSRLPEAPTNLLDDAKRGMPKAGLTFELPGGFDAFVIAFSFVFISTLMFATTYLVWKVGAIHFNEF